MTTDPVDMAVNAFLAPVEVEGMDQGHLALALGQISALQAVTRIFVIEGFHESQHERVNLIVDTLIGRLELIQIEGTFGEQDLRFIRLNGALRELTKIRKMI